MWFINSLVELLRPYLLLTTYNTQSLELTYIYIYALVSLYQVFLPKKKKPSKKKFILKITNYRLHKSL